eukprot:gene43534-58954_t
MARHDRSDPPVYHDDPSRRRFDALLFLDPRNDCVPERELSVTDPRDEMTGENCGARAPVPPFAWLRKFRAFLHDRNGVGGVEFALIAPMLLVLYLSAFELTIGLSIAKKASLASSTITDLMTRTDKVAKADLLVMEDVAKSMFVPYPSRDLSIKITGIIVSNTGAPTVAWSWFNG